MLLSGYEKEPWVAASYQHILRDGLSMGAEAGMMLRSQRPWAAMGVRLEW